MIKMISTIDAELSKAIIVEPYFINQLKHGRSDKYPIFDTINRNKNLKKTKSYYTFSVSRILVTGKKSTIGSRPLQEGSLVKETYNTTYNIQYKGEFPLLLLLCCRLLHVLPEDLTPILKQKDPIFLIASSGLFVMIDI
ncbi:hypothetical protein ACH6EH_19455 [Paenibacillus sp. JSM ZJ436]|uniref:hypothetical protein n=1 Tax=Paenibacillus sp. JSM ZJ436 TaxID=3376190 RepID=UPI0037B7594F